MRTAKTHGDYLLWLGLGFRLVLGLGLAGELG